MLLSVKSLGHYDIEARDGVAGRVRDVYFDDRQWSVRHLVVATGHALAARRVLLSPLPLLGVDPNRHVIRSVLTRSQVDASSPVDADEAVSRQHGTAAYRYYGFPYCWADASVENLVLDVPGLLDAAGDLGSLGMSDGRRGDPHLRSARAITHYYVHATDTEIGHVADLLCDDGSWTLGYLVVATGVWWPGRRVLVPTACVTGISFGRHAVDVRRSSETLRLAPWFDDSRPPSRDYLARVDAYYRSPSPTTGAPTADSLRRREAGSRR